jgi:8-oxo-dGTP diphosphatase
LETYSVNSTVCYIRSNGQTLLLRRAKEDAMQGKWIVPGGKFEPGETPEECVWREVNEETGLELLELDWRGLLTFVRRTETSIRTNTCFVFESFNFRGDLCHSQEGELRWVSNAEIAQLDIPSADRVFLPWIYESRKFFSAKFSNGLKGVAFYHGNW